MEINRLETLADFLPTIQQDKFHINYWLNANDQELDLVLANKIGAPFKVKDEDSGGYMAQEIDVPAIVHTCGTTACAVGWATTLPAFRAEGLKMGIATETFPYPGPVFDELEGLDAVGKFFDLSRAQAEWLFLPFEYDWRGRRPVLPSDVAQRIRALIADPEMELDRAF